MKKAIVVVLVFIVSAGLFLVWKGNDMREIQTEITIAAPRAKVWSILSNIDKWQDWSPVIKQANGTATLGSKLSITMCGKEGKDGAAGPKYEPVITVLEEPKRLQWRATMLAGFIFENGKILELEESGSGTRLVHTETFSGLMTPLMWGQMKKGVPPMLNSMNEALKKLAEKN